LYFDGIDNPTDIAVMERDAMGWEKRIIRNQTIEMIWEMNKTEADAKPGRERERWEARRQS